jgi:hypothetical protein
MKGFIVKIGKLVQNVVRAVGIDIFLRKPGHHYVPDVYGKTAYKHMDIRALPGFGQLAREVISEKRTSLYYDRLYTIYQAISNISQLPHHQEILSAEVGVYKGGTSKFIACAAREMSLPVRHYGFDTFEGHAGVDIAAIDGDHKARLFGDTSLETVSGYLKPFPEIVLRKGRFQDCAGEFKDNRFHFVHLDVDLYEPTLYALDFFAGRIVPGGMIVVDDYGFSTCLGIEKAVGEFLAARKDFAHVHALSGQMILMKR